MPEWAPTNGVPQLLKQRPGSSPRPYYRDMSRMSPRCEPDVKALVLDVLDELNDQEHTQSIKDKIDAVLSRVACHGSVRSGRRLRGEEMNALLREMETSPHSGQCNHGRPTYVELKLSDIERLFGRR